ncbi:single myb histone 2-like isoform X1 [Panicum virgatum]|uniref:single myb histone 2-like isoform X1 n=2 Tax=Panicum virgatum TaxID=38727 RepID=UPI0019D56C5A|nr:single myb histone 2-like isoform X1 [Panicum virgatum]XP_039851052.1 single myb histone 2-like isoform X1 [Panicum virgatum]XP_039851053.1 single myb histone 2-like isoform X1 [Panicum virgatum]XP_039851054.1 single myb histone 2-like isoform X1 [Panicum virgatum]
MNQVCNLFAWTHVSMLYASDLLPMQAGGHGQRKCRKKRTSWTAGLLKPLQSRGKKVPTREKNKHWTPLEVNKLVKGVSEYGVGKWTMVKKSYFKRSFRNPPQLKDKWRDLLRVCGIQVGSKQKVQAHKTTLRIVQGLKDEVISLHRKHGS